jgi:hypothetical protein
MPETQRDAVSHAIRRWMIDLEAYPGWKEWRRGKFGHTLYFDDLSPSSSNAREAEFKFSDEIEREHELVIQYLGLQDTINSLKECEFYFRRYPFRGLPVSRHNHITNVCEMYFGRFYEFKERLKNYLGALGAVSPGHALDIGAFIKLFEKVFDQELRVRNRIHHRHRFEDIAIDRVFLTQALAAGEEDKGWRNEHLAAYRKLTNEWVGRVRRRGKKMDEFLEAVAHASLESCPFLSDRQATAREVDWPKA